MTDRPRSLGNCDWLADHRLQAVFDALLSDDGQARVAGGAVRNALFEEPVNDIDIATTHTPEAVMRLAERAGLSAHPTGFAHGTVTVVAENEGARKPFEVTTLRRDVQTYGRHAEVAYTNDWAADAARRDFTINALYCDRYGTIFDPLGGMADVEARVVRFVGDPVARIREDHLRILRFFRFEARYGHGRINDDGLAACVSERESLRRLSAERVRAEVMRLLLARDVLRVLAIMSDTKILGIILPGRHDIGLCGRIVMIEAASGREPDPILRLFALSPGRADHIDALEKTLRLTRLETRRLRQLSAADPVSPRLREHERKAVLYRLGSVAFADAVLMSWARSADAPDDPDWLDLSQLPARWTAPVFPISGSDLQSLGVSPGPEMGRVLAALEDWWVTSGFPEDKNAVLERLRVFGIR